jgi:hypothetical protein
MLLKISSFCTIHKSSVSTGFTESELYYDRLSVGQSVLVSSPYLGLMTRFFLLSDHCGFLIWGALSDERTDLSFTIAAVFASAVILRSESRGPHDHLLLSQI